MAVDWRLAGGGFNALEALQTFGQAQQQQLQRQALQQKQAEKQRVLQSRQQASGYVQSGNFGAARQTSAAAGDFDYADFVGKLEGDQRKQLGERADLMGSLSINLEKIPDLAQRQAAFARIAPSLLQRGFSAEEIQTADLSKEGLANYRAMATDAKTALANYADANKPFDLSDGEQRFANDGTMIAENRRDARWQFDAESGSWLQEPGTGNGGGPVAQPGYAPRQASMPMAGGGGALSSMVGITAMTESGNRDYAPGGGILTSPKGAQGAMQTMPGTQTDPGFGVAPARDGSMAEKNRVGRDYLAAMVSRYGDPAKAWAAYNAGPGRVDAALERGGENWLSMMPAETRAYVAKNVRQLGGGQGGASAPSGPGVVNVRPPRQPKRENAPSGYRWNGDRQEPIPGGPADKRNAPGGGGGNDRKVETDFRKEFQNRADVKTFLKARTDFRTLRETALNPKATAQDDIATIFAFMKSLDPDSAVRETEYATAQNAGGIPDNIRNAYNKALDGERLAPRQRQAFVRTAYSAYKSRRDAYNETAEQFRGYARDYGVNPDRVARTFTPDKPAGRRANQVTSTIRRID